MQRTLKQVNAKANKLKVYLLQCTMHENFGDQQIRQLDDFIGDIYSYPYNERQAINAERKAFFDWCTTWTGKY